MSKRDRLVFMARVAPPSRRWIPAWPKGWDAEFTLLARGGFVIASAIRGGEIQPLEIASRLGEECRIRAPWPGPCRVTTRRGEPVAHEVCGDDLLTFPTERGERYRLEAR